IMEKYGEAFLVLDGASSHNAKEQKELFSIPGLTVLEWPGNSPDPNQIEPAWYDIKRSITKRGGGVASKAKTIELWEGVWKDLEQEKIEGWTCKMKSHLERCSAQNGDNLFHG
ncbi:MAG: hypothetical protein Q9228_006235, partial [Teloschistes exilis]